MAYGIHVIVFQAAGKLHEHDQIRKLYTQLYNIVLYVVRRSQKPESSSAAESGIILTDPSIIFNHYAFRKNVLLTPFENKEWTLDRRMKSHSYRHGVLGPCREEYLSAAY